MTTVFVGTIRTMVFVCTRINIVYLCIIINCYFGVVFYINMCIVDTKISFYFTPRNQFKTVGLFCSKAGNRCNRSGFTNKPAGQPVLTVRTGTFEYGFEFGRSEPVTGPTGPVNRNRWPAVRWNRSDKKTLVGTKSDVHVI